MNVATALVNNLLLLKELEDFASAMEGRPVIALKGAALLLTGLRQPDERHMEDVDVLLRPADRQAAERALDRLGYRKFPGDPCLFRRDALSVDLHDGIWYLERGELDAFWSRSVAAGESPGLRVPAPQDLLIHVLAHAAVHHAEADPKWAQDVRAIARAHPALGAPGRLSDELARLGLEPAGSEFLNRALSGGSPALRAWRCEDQGHLLRLYYLPGWRRRAAFVWKMMFPDVAFLRARYDVESSWGLAAWRVLRPAAMVAKGIAAVTAGLVSALFLREAPPFGGEAGAGGTIPQG